MLAKLHALISRSQTGTDYIDYEADVKDGEGHCVADEVGGGKRGSVVVALLLRGKRMCLCGRESNQEEPLPLFEHLPSPTGYDASKSD